VTRKQARAVLVTLKGLPPETLRKVLASFSGSALRAIAEEWWWQAHGGQIEPPACADGSDWRVWSIIAGRAFGKTRAGAEWVMARARETPDARIALVGASLDEVAKVMVEGESGLIGIARSGESLRWVPRRGTLFFPSGAAAFAYSAERPDTLRGPQHHFAWCDELAKWRQAGAAWDNLMMGLRLGERPRTIVTTTPRPSPVLKRILKLNRSVETRGRTADNPHSAADFREAMIETYAGTRLGRQELDGIMIEDVAGALWTRDVLEGSRVLRHATSTGSAAAQDERDFWKRIVVGVDPPVSAEGDACGIVVCGLGRDGAAYVLADATIEGARPEGWARRVAAAAEAWEADLVVAEKNQGGDMVESVLRGVDERLPVRLVSASRGKAARAEPIALRFESGKAKLAGCFPELEDEMAGLTAGGGYEGPGRSPDRADAMVWAMTELFERQRPEPRISLL
jgi:phage terminase large subunit-like protein